MVKAKIFFIIFFFFIFAKNSKINANETNTKTAEGTDNLIGKKIRCKISKFSKKQNNFESETEIPKGREIYIQKKDSKLLIN